MTAFLAREQELIKLNEHIDKMTKLAQPGKVLDSSTKYATFTKKGPIPNMRQNGKTDDILTNHGTKEKNTFNTKENYSLTGARKKIVLKEKPLQGIVEEKKHIFERNATGPSPRNSARSSLVNRSSQIKNPSSVVLRYKNSSFIQSPSLEILVRDENESIRSVTTSYASDFSDIPSVRPKVNLSSDGLVKFLKSRLVILQTEHDKLSQDMLNQKEMADKSMERQRKIENQRDAAYSRNNLLTEQITKLESQLSDAQQSLKAKEEEHNNTRKELEVAKREVKILTQNNANLEKRLYRINEELENSRNFLNQSKSSEKEIRESIRSETDAREKQIKALKKQRADLLNAYKKQLFLIDNLKRQNMCMEQSRMIAFGEKEFTKVLEWQSKI